MLISQMETSDWEAPSSDGYVVGLAYADSLLSARLGDLCRACKRARHANASRMSIGLHAVQSRAQLCLQPSLERTDMT